MSRDNDFHLSCPQCYSTDIEPAALIKTDGVELVAHRRQGEPIKCAASIMILISETYEPLADGHEPLHCWNCGLMFGKGDALELQLLGPMELTAEAA